MITSVGRRQENDFKRGFVSLGEIDLGEWLMPGEPVRWEARVEQEMPWSRLARRGLPVLVMGVGACWLLFPRRVGHVPTTIYIALASIAAVGILQLASFARRATRPRWYVLTDRRAAVFQEPTRLIGQVGVQTPEFSARHGRDGYSGTVDWGPSDPLPAAGNGQRPRAQGEFPISDVINRFGASIGLDDGDVVFKNVADLETLMAAVRQVRAAWSVETPEPMAFESRDKSLQSRESRTAPLGFIDSEAAGILNAAVLAVGSIAIVTSGVLLVISLVFGVRSFSFAPVAAVFVVIFPLHLWTVVVSKGRQRRTGEPWFTPTRQRGGGRSAQVSVPMDYLPRWASRLVGATFFACALVAVVQLTTDHKQTAVSPNRFFLAISLAFLVISVAATSNELIRRRRSPYTKRWRGASNREHLRELVPLTAKELPELTNH